MATERIIIQVESRGFKTVQRDIRNVQKSAKSSATILQQLRNVLVVVAAVRVIRRFTDLADSFVNLQNRLQSTLGSLEAARSAQQRIINIARETRTSVEATGDAFARFALGTRDLGISTNRLLKITRTLNQALILSGATAQEARNGLIQLAQGIASNRLGGDELRAVLEQLPPVAIAIAKELGVTIGQLRDLGAQGKITGEVVLRALEGVASETEKAFGNTITTIDQALVGLGTNFTVFINEILNVTGISQNLVGAINSLSQAFLVLGNNIDALKGIGTTLAIIFGAKGVASVLKFASTFGIIQDAVLATAGTSNILKIAWIALRSVAVSLFAVIAANPLAAFVTVLAAVVGAIVYLRSNIVTLDDTIQESNNTLEANRKALDAGLVTSTKVARAKIQEALAIKQATAARLEEAKAQVGTGVLSDFASFLGATNTAKDKVEALDAAIAESNKQIAELRKIFKELAPAEDAAANNLDKVTEVSTEASKVIAKLEFELAQLNRTARDQAIGAALNDAELAFSAQGATADRIRELAGAIYDVSTALEEEADRAKEAAEAIEDNTNRAKKLFQQNLPLAERTKRLDQELADVRGVLQKLTGSTAEAEKILTLERAKGIEEIKEEIASDLLSFREDQATLTEQLAKVQKDSNEIKRQAILLGASESEAIAEQNRFIESQNKLLIENSESRQLANRFFTADAGIRDFAAAQEELRKNGEAAGLTFQQQNELLQANARELAGASNAALEYAQAEKAVNFALKEGAISAEEAINLNRQNRIELLESQKTAEAGLERGLLKFVDDATNAAAQTEALFTDTFNSLSDELFNFVKTGEFDFNNLVQTIIDGLLRIAVQQAVGGAFGLGQSAFGGAGGGIAGSSGASGGSAGGIGGFIASGIGGLLGFQQGGSFKVGAGTAVATLPGVDNRLISFKARDGEDVSVTPKGRPGPEGTPPPIIFNVAAKDANSFNRSASQIQARLAASVQQAQRRR